MPASPQGNAGQLRDFLGGDLMCSLLAAINFPSPVPAMRAAGMHGHVFLNGGNMALLGGTGKGLRESWQEFATTFRWSIVSCGVCGAGTQRVARAVTTKRGVCDLTQRQQQIVRERAAEC